MSKEMDDLERELRDAWGLQNEELIRPVAWAAQKSSTVPLRERHQGALAEGAQQAGVPLNESRRKFLTLGLRVPLQVAMTSVLKNPITALIASGFAAVETGYQIAHEHSDDERNKHSVRRQFVERIERLSYLDSGEISDLDLNQGEGAILDSLRCYRHGSIQELATIQPELRLAAEKTENLHGQALARWRLMVDSSYLGLGEDARVWLDALQLRGIGDDLKLKFIDGATATALNLMSPEEFSELKSPSYDRVSQLWESIGWDLTDVRSIAGHYEHGSIGTLTTAVQHLNILSVRTALSSKDVSAVRDTQATWFESLWELNHRLHEKPLGKQIAFDFLQSLTRLTFFAAATGNDELVESILDCYFGRTLRRSDSATVKSARETIANQWLGNSLWLLLLDLVMHDRAWSTLRFEQVLHSGHGPGRSVCSPSSPQLMKALIYVGKRLGFSEDRIAERFNIRKASAEVPKTTLVRYYLEQLDRSFPSQD